MTLWEELNTEKWHTTCHWLATSKCGNSLHMFRTQSSDKRQKSFKVIFTGRCMGWLSNPWEKYYDTVLWYCWHLYVKTICCTFSHGRRQGLGFQCKEAKTYTHTYIHSYMLFRRRKCMLAKFSSEQLFQCPSASFLVGKNITPSCNEKWTQCTEHTSLSRTSLHHVPVR